MKQEGMLASFLSTRAKTKHPSWGAFRFGGDDVKIVSKLLGHFSVKITYDTYVHLFENDIKCVTCVLD